MKNLWDWLLDHLHHEDERCGLEELNCNAVNNYYGDLVCNCPHGTEQATQYAE